MFPGKPANALLVANPFTDQQTPPSRPVFNTQTPKPSMNEIKQVPFVASSQFGSAGSYSTNTVGFTTSSTAYGSSNQLNQPFGSNGTLFGGAQSQPVQDPWAPVTSNNNSQLGAPWVKQGEQANPFLS